MTRPNKITAHNAGWRSQFRFRGSPHRPGVCEFYRSATGSPEPEPGRLPTHFGYELVRPTVDSEWSPWNLSS